MADILILGGGFGGVVAAERLAKTLGSEHRITLVSRTARFTFYPALVRLAFGACEPDDICFDLRAAMLDRRVRFIEAEVARVDPHARTVTLTGGDVVGDLRYDYLIFALGRRLATERVKGFYEYAHHLLSVASALKFGAAVREFHGGHAVIGSCPGARLEVPVYETAFALARRLAAHAERARLSVISPEYPSLRVGSADIARAAAPALDAHHVTFIKHFPISEVTPEVVRTDDGLEVEYDLLMLVPPFTGPAALSGTGLTDDEGYVRTERTMRVVGCERMYAIGDCVSLPGPKMGHMAVRQGEVAARNVAAEIAGRTPAEEYEHEMMLVIDEGGGESSYLHEQLWGDGAKTARAGRFWGWAKRIQQHYWQAQHS
jgi:sulfide:quinone oxidoreductase